MDSNVSIKAGPSEEQWALHRSLISQLYHVESRTLKEVMVALENNFAFKASEKMYKTRIRLWQLDKKRKGTEMIYALETIERRRRQGKLTRVTIRGKEVKEAELRQYFKRRKRPISQDKMVFEGVETPPEVKISTPTIQTVRIPALVDASAYLPQRNERYGLGDRRAHFSGTHELCSADFASSSTATDGFFTCNTIQPEVRVVRHSSSAKETGFSSLVELLRGERNEAESPLKSLVEDSRCYPTKLSSFHSFVGNDVCEAVLQQLNAYFANYYFESDHWASISRETLKAARRINGITIWGDQQVVYARFNDPGHMTSAIEVAVQLLNKGQAEDSFDLVHSVCASLQALVNEQHPQLLSSLLMSVNLVSMTRYSGISQVVLRHFHDMAEVILGPRHPLTTLSSEIAKALLVYPDIADHALGVLLDVFTSRIGESHPARLHTMYTRAWARLRRGELDKAQDMFEMLQSIYVRISDPNAAEARKLLYSLAQVRIAQGETMIARELLDEHQRRTEECFGSNTPVESKIENLRVRALLCRRAGEFERMHLILHLQQAYAAGTRILTLKHPTMILLQQQLQDLALHPDSSLKISSLA